MIADLQVQADTQKLISCRVHCQNLYQRIMTIAGQTACQNTHDMTVIQSRRYVASKPGHTFVIIDGPCGDVTCTNIDRNHKVWPADTSKPHELHHIGGNVG